MVVGRPGLIGRRGGHLCGSAAAVLLINRHKRSVLRSVLFSERKMTRSKKTLKNMSDSVIGGTRETINFLIDRRRGPADGDQAISGGNFMR
jgi:hypothetical protein